MRRGGMSRSASAKEAAIAPVTHRDRAALPAHDTAALARRVPLGRRIVARVGKDQRCRELARRDIFLETVEQAKPLGEPPAFGRAGLPACGHVRRRTTGNATMQSPGRGLADFYMPIGGHHISERLVALAVSDPEPVSAPFDRQYQVPFAVRDQFRRNNSRTRDVRHDSSEKTRWRRSRDRGERAELGPPDGGRMLGTRIGVNGERPTPIGWRADPARHLPVRSPTPRDNRRDSAGCGAGIPARNRRDHIVRISSENLATASHLPDPLHISRSQVRIKRRKSAGFHSDPASGNRRLKHKLVAHRFPIPAGRRPQSGDIAARPRPGGDRLPFNSRGGSGGSRRDHIRRLRP